MPRPVKTKNDMESVARDEEGEVFGPETADIKRGGKKFELAVDGSYKTNTTHVKTDVANHSEATDFMCDDCGQKCNMEDKLGQHGKSMDKEGGSVACPYCKKTFTSILTLGSKSNTDMKRKCSLALFATAASLKEIRSRLMWQIIQRKQISCVMIVARNAIGKTN